MVLLGASRVQAQGPPPDRRFGAVEAFRDPVAAAEAGVGWERILFYWSELQPNGPEDWNGYHVPDDWLALASSDGREVVGLLKSTPQWATDGQAGCGVPRGLDLPVGDPSNLWAAFVRRTVSAYSDRVKHWIVWNEPDIAPDGYGAEWCGTMGEYYQLLKVAYLAAHEVDPNVTIHLTGLTHWHDDTTLRRLLGVASQDPTAAANAYYFDVVSLHVYFTTESVPDIVGQTRATLGSYGISKPIWINETNAAPSSDPKQYLPAPNFVVSLEEQAGFLLQTFSLALAEGVERIAVYKMLDDVPELSPEPYGMIRLDSSRRPAFYAFRLITTHYAGTDLASVEWQPEYVVVTLDRSHQMTRVLWARTEADVEATVPALASEARLIDQTGAEQILQPVDGNYVIQLPRAVCADSRGCIIGGPTFLLVEDTGRPPTPTGSPTPEVIESPTSLPEPEMPSPVPTVTPLPSRTPSPTLPPTPVPTEAPTLPPPPVAEPSPTSSNLGRAPSEPSEPARGGLAVPIGAGVGGMVLLALAVVMFLRQRR